MAVSTTPLPAGAALANGVLRLPASAAGQVLCLLDGAGQPVPLCTLRPPAAPAPTLADTDGLPEGTTNLYYTDSRTDARFAAFFRDGFFEYLGFSPSEFAFPPLGDVVEANPRTRNVYSDTIAATYDVDLPIGDSTGGFGDFGTMVEFCYAAAAGGLLTLNFTNGAKVNGQSSLQLWPGDVLLVAREAVGPPPATRKNFKLVRATNNKFAGLASTGFRANSSEPATPVGGGVLYVENGALKFKGSSGTVTPLAPA